jgi:cholesterol oxidase
MDQRVLDDERWPEPLRGGDRLLADGHERALRMLGSTPLPRRYQLAKLDSLEDVARSFEAAVVRPKLNVTFDDSTNEAGIDQPGCTLCGNCVTGCNDGSKNTVLMNYLPDAVRHGAEVYTRTVVNTVERVDDDLWRVTFDVTESEGMPIRNPTRFVHARVVVLAAGTLGSTEIMLRSARAGLAVSEQLGKRFSGNGDVIAFAFDSDRFVNSVGCRRRMTHPEAPPGPTITGMVDLRQRTGIGSGMVVEDAGAPAPLARALAGFLALAAAFEGEETRVRRALRRSIAVVRGLTAVAANPYTGPLNRTQGYLVQSTDDDGGELQLGEDIELVWPRAGSQAVFEHVDRALWHAAESVGGVYVRNPTWTRSLGRSLLTVHPLGGCVIAARAEDGVVDHRGRVFSGPTGSHTYRGLYIADGSIVPVPLGVNPSLTIAALAERACTIMIEEDPWGSAPTVLQRAPLGRRRRVAGLRFRERLRGSCAFGGTAATGGDLPAPPSPVELVLTVETDDLHGVIGQPDRPIGMYGTAHAPALSNARLDVVDGAFTMFEPSATDPRTTLVRYHLPLVTESGRHFLLKGEKTLTPGSLAHLWKQFTEMPVVAFDAEGAEIGTGTLQLSPRDVLLELCSFRAPGAPGAHEALLGLGHLAAMFLSRVAKLARGSRATV